MPQFAAQPLSFVALGSSAQPVAFESIEIGESMEAEQVLLTSIYQALPQNSITSL